MLGLPQRWVAPGEEVGQGRGAAGAGPQPGCRSSSITRWSRPSACCNASTCYRGAHIMRLDHFNCQVPTVRPAYEFYTRRTWLSADRVHRDRRSGPAPLGRLAAPQGQRPRPGADERQGAAPAPRRLLAARRAGRAARLRHPGRRADARGDRARARAATASPTPSSSTCATRTATASSSTPATTSRSTPTSPPIRWSINDPRRQTFWGHAAARLLVRGSRAGRVRHGRPLHAADGRRSCRTGRSL